MGTFYICPTPIGNLNDISTRLVQVLSEVDIIYAEDTRIAKKLLSHLNQKKEIRSYFKGNEIKKIDTKAFSILLGGIGREFLKEKNRFLISNSPEESANSITSIILNGIKN